MPRFLAVFCVLSILVGCGSPPSAPPGGSLSEDVRQDGGPSESDRYIEAPPDGGSGSGDSEPMGSGGGSARLDGGFPEADVDSDPPSKDGGMPPVDAPVDTGSMDSGVAPDVDAGDPRICTPGTALCQGSILRVCQPDGLSFKSSTCPHLCSDDEGACVGECTPGEIRCNEDDVETCDASGSWQTSSTCPFVCSGAACTGSCDPGTKQCNGDNVEVCNEVGEWEVQETCEFVCSSGACAGSCTPGAKQCSSGTVQTCNSGGTWDTTEVCPFLCSSGACTGSCTPGAQDCQGDTPRTCNAQGQWVAGSECPFLCSAGSCTGSCEPGAEECNGLTPRSCNSSGQWVDASSCPYVCSAGNCTGVCSPGAKRCSGGNAQVCNSSGQWQLAESCDYVCSSGSCTGECTPGTKECDGTGTRTCGNDGFWEPTVACSESTEPASFHLVPSCSEGTCGFECEEGYADCFDSGDGSCETHLTSSALNCGACGHYCGSGACEDSLCTPYSAARRIQGHITSAPAVDTSGALYFGEYDSIDDEHYVVESDGLTSIEFSAANVVHWVYVDGGELCWTEFASGTGDLFCEGDPRLTGQTRLGDDRWQTVINAGKVTWDGKLANRTGGAVTTLESPNHPSYIGSHAFVTSTHAYWTLQVSSLDNRYDIKRKAHSGGSIETLVIDEEDVWSIWAEGNSLFWINHHPMFSSEEARVVKKNMNTGQETIVYSAADEQLYMLTSDGTYLYWFAENSSGAKILRWHLSGGPVRQLTPNNLDRPDNHIKRNLVVGEDYLYWTDAERIRIRGTSKHHWSDF